MSDNQALVHRLNRIVGQIQGLSKRLESGEDKNCVQTIQQLKASINALKKFGEAYVSSHMEECLAKQKDPDSMKQELSDVVKGVFSL